MGLLCEYFTAAGDEHAAAVIDWPAGPAAGPSGFDEVVRSAGVRWPWRRRGVRPTQARRTAAKHPDGVGTKTACFNGLLPTDAVDLALLLLPSPGGETQARSGTSPRFLVERHDGALSLYRLPEDLTRLLAAATGAELKSAGERWATAREQDDVDAELAVGVLHELAELARAASWSGHDLYCWVCV